jgi:hypothetical protein
MMKTAKAQKIHPKSTSRRFDTKMDSATGIEKIGGGDHGVGCDMEPDQFGFPQQANPMR